MYPLVLHSTDGRAGNDSCTSFGRKDQVGVYQAISWRGGFECERKWESMVHSNKLLCSKIQWSELLFKWLAGPFLQLLTATRNGHDLCRSLEILGVSFLVKMYLFIIEEDNSGMWHLIALHRRRFP